MKLGLYVYNSCYDHNFKPIMGSLKASYNGIQLSIAVDGTDISCKVNTPEHSFLISLEQVAPTASTWEEIVELSLKQVIFHLTSSTMNQVVHLQHTGEYRVH